MKCSSCWPTPKPQQCGIWAASETYTTVHISARYLIHWVKPGLEPTSSWKLVGFVSTEPQWELHTTMYLSKKNKNVLQQKDSYMNVHSRISHDSSKLETAQLSNRCKGKTNCCIFLDYDKKEKKKLLICTTKWMDLKNGPNKRRLPKNA